MSKTKIILAGGFLGAGKTTLLWEAARRAAARGLRVGLITNDQAPELVDSALLSRSGLKVAEVSGSCFCCNFNGLISAIQEVRREAEADVIIAEPVGSCTDLSATVAQPLKQLWGHELQLAPLSVLADPARLSPILDGGAADLHPDAAYIYRKQLEESDAILVTKTDLLQPDELATLMQRVGKAYPLATLLPVSALTGSNVDEWLDMTLTRSDAGLRLAEVDYDVYAHGEAVLGWLNGTVRLHGKPATDWNFFTRNFLETLAEQLRSKRHSVGHVKVAVESGGLLATGSIAGNAATPAVRGRAGIGAEAKLVVNARAEATPEELNKAVREALNAATHSEEIAANVAAWRYLQPGRPQPTHRFANVFFRSPAEAGISQQPLHV
ncbi:MAG: cobalamin synthesis protein P47K [Prevotellaceae bacterium]|jgi:G3E family GTPase|nr:cobalamin synthesis protein P47K [Prevotellaceae bacterium]